MVILDALMDNNKKFTHLKVHTQYSICEGAIKINDLKESCKRNKVAAVGLSDSFNLCGALEFSENLTKVGVQPIIGTQINFKINDQIGSLPLIASNYIGYKNIIELSSNLIIGNYSLIQ